MLSSDMAEAFFFNNTFFLGFLPLTQVGLILQITFKEEVEPEPIAFYTNPFLHGRNFL